MRLFRTTVVAALVCLAVTLAVTPSFAPDARKPRPADEALVGSWLGDMNGSRIYFQVSRRWDGGLMATTGCIEAVQSALPVDSATLTTGAVKFMTKRVQLSYDGNLSADGKTIDGTMSIGRRKTPVALEKVDVIPGPNRPQTPRAPYPYVERAVHYRNDAAGITIAGTLTVPRGKGPFPAVLLIAGSGPADRNEEFAFHRPLAVVADYLTRRGIAVLRVDKRGVGESQGDCGSSSVSDLASDALFGVKFLAGLPEVDSKRIGLVGHSEGGIVAPIVAAETQGVSFVVLMGGPAMSEFEIMVLQDGSQAVAAGASEKQAALIRAWSRRYYTIVRDTPDAAEARRKLEALKAARTPEERQAYKYLGDVGTLDIDTALERGFVEDLRTDFSQYLPRMKCPALSVFGGKDCQVPAAANWKVAEEAFKKGGNADAKVVTLPGLNHLFQKCETGDVAEYDSIEETISPDVLKTVGDWIEGHTRAHK